MSLIDDRLAKAYSVMVLADKYILQESDRSSADQKIVPERLRGQVEILVSERTIEVLGN